MDKKVHHLCFKYYFFIGILEKLKKKHTSNKIIYTIIVTDLLTKVVNY